MVEAGARVVIGDILEERGRETARAIGTDASAVFQRLDVTSEEDWNAAIGAATARWGGLDILVNNAGMLLGKVDRRCAFSGTACYAIRGPTQCK
jgi:3(or 17)beta-hydroxysteroid dehydrogenase